MKILLTGATGFLGAEILAELLNQDEIEVIAWGRDPTRVKALKRRFSANIHSLRVEQRDLFESNPRSLAIDAVIHAAALRPPTIQNPSDLAHANVEGTRQIVRLAEQAGCQRILYISTQSVYGSRGAPWAEDAPLCPETPYAISKCDGETEMLRSNRINATILRISRLYGVTPFTRWEELPGRFAKAVSRAEPLTIHGTGEQRSDFVHVRDAARAVIMAALAPSKSSTPRIYNVGNGRSVSLNELVRLFRQLAPTFGFPPITVQRIPDHSLGGMQHLELNTACIRETFAWSPKINLREGLAEYLKTLSSSDTPRADC